MIQLTHIIAGNTGFQRERGTVGDDKHPSKDVRIMGRGRWRKLGLPGTKTVKQARETKAQKSSHQNMHFWMRRASRAMVIKLEIRKKANEESVVCGGQ